MTLLKETTEYGDLDDDEIQIAARRAAMPAGSVSSKLNRAGASTDATTQGGGPKSAKDAKNNDWIPT